MTKWDDDRLHPLTELFRKKPGWTEPKRGKEAMPEHPRWEGDRYFHSPDGLHKGLSVLIDSPGMQQRIRDRLVVNFDNRTVTQWVDDLISRELPNDHYNYRDGYDPKVLLKPKDPD